MAICTTRKVRPVIELTTDHTGKMLGMQSLSTSCRLNPGCQRNSKIPGSICEKCYAQTMLQMYKDLDAKLDRNTEALTVKVLDWDDLPIINCQVFRFESFGDLYNEVHLQNYINIAKKNPGCRFTLWTKNYGVAMHYFKEHDCPENFTLIISSLFVNKKQDLAPFKKLGKFKKGQLKVFTVYDYDYIKQHADELNINCGSRLCLGCRLCYDKNEVEEINEILKSDQEKTEQYLDTLKPDYNDRMAAALDEIGDLDSMFDEGGDEESSPSLDINNEKEVESNEGKNAIVTDGDYDSGCTHQCGGCPYAGMCGGVGNYEGASETEKMIAKEAQEKRIDNLTKLIGNRLKDLEFDHAETAIDLLVEFAKKLYEEKQNETDGKEE